jgi:hypothetical protein
MSWPLAFAADPPAYSMRKCDGDEHRGASFLRFWSLARMLLLARLTPATAPAPVAEDAAGAAAEPAAAAEFDEAPAAAALSSMSASAADGDTAAALPLPLPLLVVAAGAGSDAAVAAAPRLRPPELIGMASRGRIGVENECEWCGVCASPIKRTSNMARSVSSRERGSGQLCDGSRWFSGGASE